MTIRISDAHGPRLARMQPAPIAAAFGAQLELSADLIVRDAQASIMEGSGGGVRSAPGEAPNNQTGELRDSGFIVPSSDVAGQVKAAAGFGTDHALPLERGTSKMYPRPFLAPATERQRGGVLHGLANRFREVVGLK